MKSQKYPQQTIIERKFQEQIFDKICEDLKVFAPFTTPQRIKIMIGATFYLVEVRAFSIPFNSCFSSLYIIRSSRVTINKIGPIIKPRMPNNINPPA